MRSLRSRLSGGGAIRARCCSMRASLWMSSILFGPSTFRRACQFCLSLRSITSCMASSGLSSGYTAYKTNSKLLFHAHQCCQCLHGKLDRACCSYRTLQKLQGMCFTSAGALQRQGTLLSAHLNHKSVARLQASGLLDLLHAHEIGIHALCALLAGIQQVSDGAHQLTQALYLLSLGAVNLHAISRHNAQGFVQYRQLPATAIAWMLICTYTLNFWQSVAQQFPSAYILKPHAKQGKLMSRQITTHLSEKLSDAAMHNLLCEHSILVQVPYKLDVAKRSPSCLHSRRERLSLGTIFGQTAYIMSALQHQQTRQ